jgi:hypothetical protein
MGSLVTAYGWDSTDNNLVDQDDLKNISYLTNHPEFRINRDNSLKLDTTDIFQNADLNFLFAPIVDTAISGGKIGTYKLNDEKCVLLEAKITGKLGSETKEYKALFYNSSSICGQLQASGTTYPYTLIAGGYVNIENIKSSMLVPQLSSSTVSIKPIGADIKFMIKKSGGGDINGPFATVTSTGYYGGTTRTMSANIDRQSGTVYDLFDYVIYQKQ